MKTKYNPLVSIIIANYNNEVYLKKCFDQKPCCKFIINHNIRFLLRMTNLPLEKEMRNL